MGQTNWIDVAALIIGPVSAVVITLIWERVRRSRERRVQLLQTIMALSVTPANAWFTNAINTLPFEFAGNAEVLSARLRLLEKGLQDEEVIRRIDALIWAIMKALGMKVPVTPTPQERYFARGLGEHEERLIAALLALPKIAEAAETSAKVNIAMLRHMLGLKPDLAGPSQPESASSDTIEAERLDAPHT
jgi:hypothetical protein